MIKILYHDRMVQTYINFITEIMVGVLISFTALFFTIAKI